jgi:hypothetical protein
MASKERPTNSLPEIFWLMQKKKIATDLSELP